jgi:hypothetical protein
MIKEMCCVRQFGRSSLTVLRKGEKGETSSGANKKAMKET